MNAKQYLCILATMLLISGCISTEEPETTNLLPDVLPSAHPPLTTEMLQQTSSTCKQQVNQLWQKRFSISKEKQKDFHEMIGSASKDCNDLIEAFKYLQSTTHQYTSYQQALQSAQSYVDGVPTDTFSQPDLSSQNTLIEHNSLEK